MTAAPTVSLSAPLAQLEQKVAQDLSHVTRLGIAYSGGVDSATLAALAVRTLGRANVVALLGVSPSLAARERKLAHEAAQQIGVEVHEIETHEGERPEYRANAANRCYFCKDELFTRIEEDVVDSLGLDAVAYGENADDAIRPDRPGAGAATQHRVLHPLAKAGITKAQVRAIARELRIPVANKPAAPCLASRIPHGQDVTPEKLRQVELLEDAVFAAGFSDCRVRHHGEIARIEVPRGEIAKALDDQVRGDLEKTGKAVGFSYVTLDLSGIQSGKFTLSISNAKGTL